MQIIVAVAAVQQVETAVAAKHAIVPFAAKQEIDVATTVDLVIA